MSSHYGNVKTVEILVEAGANVDARDQHGRTPLYDAAEESLHEAVLALLKHGADVNVRVNGEETALHDAAFHAGMEGKFTAETVDILLRWGADETAVNADGCTLADIAGGTISDRITTGLPRISSACTSCWRTLRPTGLGVVGDT